MAGVAEEDNVVKEDRSVVGHRYRICEITRTGERGRPRRIEIMAWEDLKDDEVDQVRRLNEPRLKPNQIAELDGRTVARGDEVPVSEVEASEPPLAAASIRGDNPFEMVEFARRMSWDLYERDAEASARLREEAHQLTQRALEQGKQALELIEQLKAQAQRPAPVPQGRPLSLEDISKLIQVGASAVGEIMRQRPEK